MQKLPTGVIGCLDPKGSFFVELSAWAQDQGASPAHEADGMGLWVWPGGAAAHHLRAPDLCGYLEGNIFEREAAPTATTESGSVVEKIVRAYRQNDPGFAAHWVGQYGLILLDLRRRLVLLYRDETGAKSLYYSVRPSGGILFSDCLDLLVASPPIEKRLSRASLHEYLRFLDVSTPNTIYDQVFATEPGVRYLIDEQGIRTREPGSSPEQRLQREPLESVAAELERLVRRAVEQRVDYERPMTAFLSGGVDSALLCAMAAQMKDVRLQALTVGFADRSLDESQVAKAIATHLKIPHRVLSFSMDACRNAFGDVTTGIEFPFADPAAIPTLLAFRHARNIGAVAFDGTGADGLFGSMPPRHQRLAISYGALLPSKMRLQSARLMKALPILRGYAPLLDFEEPEQILIRWRGWTRRQIERLCGESVYFENTLFYKVFRSYPRNDHFARYSALLRSMPDDRLHQIAMLTGLDVRFPYQDPEVKKYVLGRDVHYAGESKRLLKAVLERRVPRSIWDVPKHGFDFPFLDLMIADDCALIKQYLNPALTQRWGLFDQDELDAVVRRFMVGDRQRPVFAPESSAFRVWALVVLFAWLENHYRYV